MADVIICAKFGVEKWLETYVRDKIFREMIPTVFRNPIKFQGHEIPTDKRNLSTGGGTAIFGIILHLSILFVSSDDVNLQAVRVIINCFVLISIYT